MKQNEIEAKPLIEHKDFDERDTLLESSGAFIMAQSTASLSEPRFEPTTSGYKSNALSTRPRLPCVWHHWQATQWHYGHGPFHYLKFLISLDFNILRNIWGNVSTQVCKMYNTVLVVFGYLNKKIVHCAFNSDSPRHSCKYLYLDTTSSERQEHTLAHTPAQFAPKPHSQTGVSLCEVDDMCVSACNPGVCGWIESLWVC